MITGIVIRVAMLVVGAVIGADGSPVTGLVIAFFAQPMREEELGGGTQTRQRMARRAYDLICTAGILIGSAALLLGDNVRFGMLFILLCAAFLGIRWREDVDRRLDEAQTQLREREETLKVLEQA